MKLYQLPDRKFINLDALVHLSEPQLDHGDYWANAICEATFALVEKPIKLRLATYPFTPGGDGPQLREKKRAVMLRKAQREHDKLVLQWSEAKFND